ncbi:hypothetical protein B0H16DRAFT_1882327 [Mycena metata]|uniref:Uncharacterized protein n=1 Tax=Mycena metata TaxID=1033252 RepID=A0AAD7JSE7_9AGAR|nr:hypothetical protein B0H16DRAFT_1882327 [Mycena metata]
MDKIITLLPFSEDHRAKASFTVRLFGRHRTHSIPFLKALMAQTFEWLKTLDDPDLEATFYTNLGNNYSELDIHTALKYCQMGLSLAKSHGNIKEQSAALDRLSWIKWQSGDYITAQAYAQEAQRLAKKSGDLQSEAHGLYKKEICHAPCFANVSKLGWDSFLRSAKEKLGIYKALQFIGDVHLMQNDELTAVSLFTVALHGFTYMDVHRSRAECMIRLGDMAKKNGDLLKALELWEIAKPLFEHSLQAKRVQDIDRRVGDISEETKEQYRKNLACLVELNVPVGKVEEVDSDTEELGLEEEQIKLIAV